MTEQEARQRVIAAMCPQRVCRICGEPSRRLVKSENQAGERQALARYLKERRERTGMSQKDLAVWFPSVSGGLTGCVWNWENAASVPTADQWLILKSLLEMDDRFDLLVTGERTWTEYLAEYVPQSGPGKGTAHLPAMVNPAGRGFEWHEANRIAPSEFSDCGHDDWRPGVWLDPFAAPGEI